MKKRPTMKDIAKKIGVTPSTISRVLNNEPSIGPVTRQKVLKVLAEMNYQPNLIARSLVTQRTRCLAFIASIPSPKFFFMIRGLADTCRRYNYGLMLFSTEFWMDEEISYLNVARNWSVDGILIYNIVYRDDVGVNVKKLQMEGVPIVYINKYLRSHEVNTVSIDNRDAVLQAVTHLVDLGHKKIGVINGNLLSVDGRERFDAWKEAMKVHTLECNEKFVGNGDFSEGEGYEEMRKIISLPNDRPTAMFCANDLMAMGAIRAIQEKGLKVPQDIAVVGFDDAEECSLFKPALTTLKLPLDEIGGKAINLMMHLIENPGKEVEEIALRAKLIVRNSSVS